jgi:hypothetical protein
MHAPRPDDILQRKRELRLRIGRSRRRINSRLRATQQRARQLLTWRTYVARHPAVALAAALGAGMTASAALRRERFARWLGRCLLRGAMGGFQRHLRNELLQIWKDLTPKP